MKNITTDKNHDSESEKDALWQLLGKYKDVGASKVSTDFSEKIFAKIGEDLPKESKAIAEKPTPFSPIGLLQNWRNLFFNNFAKSYIAVALIILACLVLFSLNNYDKPKNNLSQADSDLTALAEDISNDQIIPTKLAMKNLDSEEIIFSKPADLEKSASTHSRQASLTEGNDELNSIEQINQVEEFAQKPISKISDEMLFALF